MSSHASFATTLALLLSTAPALAQTAPTLSPVSPDELAFSVTNMDPSVSPGADFYRYASGAWQDRVQRPERLAMYGIFDMMGERQKAQMKALLAQIGAEASAAPKGSPEQQVGTFYNAFMDTAARDAAGMMPLQPQLDAIAAIGSMDDLVRYLATARATTSAPPALLLLKPDIGLKDSSRYVINAGAGSFGVPFDDVLAEAPMAPAARATGTIWRR